MTRFVSPFGRPKKSSVSGLFWHEPSRLFRAYVGYHVRKILTRKGMIREKRVRSTFYFKGDEAAAAAAFGEKKREWQQVKEEHRRRRAVAATQRIRLPRCLPVWPPKAPAISCAAFERCNADLTLLEARSVFLAIYEARVGLLCGKGIRRHTYNRFRVTLDLALGLNPQYARPQRPIDLTKKLGELTITDLEAFARFWCDPANVGSERTTLNHMVAFRKMMRGLRVPFPQGAEEALRVRITQPPAIVRYNPEQLRALLKGDHSRSRTFQLMALNLGYYPVDIARLRLEHITDAEGNPYRGGETFITRRREKTMHQNTFATTHYVWPETQAAMEFCRARANPFGTYFLSKLGTPYTEFGVGEVVSRAIASSGFRGQFAMKQYRKIGASQIKAISGSDAMHQYKANSLSPADRPYVLEDYSVLTNALKLFREKLLADQVI